MLIGSFFFKEENCIQDFFSLLFFIFPLSKTYNSLFSLRSATTLLILLSKTIYATILGHTANNWEFFDHINYQSTVSCSLSEWFYIIFKFFYHFLGVWVRHWIFLEFCVDRGFCCFVQKKNSCSFSQLHSWLSVSRTEYLWSYSRSYFIK